MVIKYFDYKDWVKKEYNYASLLNLFYNHFSKEQLKSILEKEMDTKLLTKKQIQKFFDVRRDLSWVKWGKHIPINELNIHNKYHAQSIGLRGQYSAVKLVLEEDIFRKKVGKPTVDKMLTIHIFRETLQAHKSKRIRKIIYLSS
jgi:hypothetical protein